ncbi:MAG: glycoside hydrolase family 20 protein [Firmicutes bacterium]|nr:glycoside hydrolase family 20 protein [Bacillota bacterium]MCM1401912.1 glycoside hydrolase family 20 protein [Bacteroides sp.]MCM1477826.1 glycoside hydrolase family 20 protein [Bacteroides sp.]
MKKRIITCLMVAATLLMQAAGTSKNINIIPRPAEMNVLAGSFTLPIEVKVMPLEHGADSLAREVVSGLNQAGYKSTITAEQPSITVVSDAAMGKEQYSLAVTTAGITIKAATGTGAYYAAQTLAQIVGKGRELPVCEINDHPRMGYRGLMLDVVRCYIPVDEIKKFIDVAARLKINNLHLHLTDDNGWRLEIKKYPKLTEVGAWRVYRPELFPGRLNQRSAQEPTPVGGFYTQKEMRELVKYAAERHVNIIPEIEMPAHAAAAIASYPNLACPVNDKFVGVFPGIGGKDASIIMCAGNDDVYKFYEDVLDEVMDIFPSPLINLGGDEANKALWEKCELCQQRIAAEDLKDCEELQGYFMDRINHYVRSHGRTAMGWDEVTYGNPKEDMVILGWQGDGTTASEYSRRTGRKFIMTPAKTTYLIRYQGPQWFEPWTYFGNNTLTDIHAYEPVAATWTPEMESNLLGVQGSLWSEFCSDASDVQYLVFPRLLAVADVGWRQKGTGNLDSFLSGVDNFMPVLDSLGINYARSMWNIQHTVTPAAPGEVTVALECERPDVEIRYSIGDSTFQTLYTAPLHVTDNSVIHAATFKDGVQMGRTLTLDINRNKATGARVEAANCRNNLANRLTNGLRGSNRNSDFEWAGWWNGDAEFTIDLGEALPVNSVKLGTLINSDICVVAPKSMQLLTSTDGVNFTPAGEIEVDSDVVLAHPAKIVDFDFGNLSLPEVRYLKVRAESPGKIPDGMAREGTNTWMYFDEIIVE